MIYTKNALFAAIAAIDGNILANIERHAIGIPEALRDCAVEVLMNGDCNGNEDATARWRRAIDVIRAAMHNIDRNGCIVYGDQDGF